MKEGLGAKPPARGSTPVPRPQPSDYRYKQKMWQQTKTIAVSSFPNPKSKMV
jgi:hypothetical protein